MKVILALLSAIVGNCFLNFEAIAEVYLSKEQALELVLGSDVEHKHQPMVLTSDQQEELSKLGLLAGEMPKAHFFVGNKSGQVTGYALIDQEVGKHLPITYIVGLDLNGQVTRVEMMVFREVRGWEARERQFVSQFQGKKFGDSFGVGNNIKHITGATLSCRHVTDGVRRILATDALLREREAAVRP